MGPMILGIMGCVVMCNIAVFSSTWLSSVSLICGHCLQCFDAVGWAAGRASGLYKTEWWDVGVVVWDEVQTCI